MEELAGAVRERTRELEQANLRLRQEAEDRIRLETRLSHAQRLDALGQLAAGLAHEVNNPLSFVMANIHHVHRELAALLASQATQDVTELQDACHDALLGCERIQRLVQDVRLFARVGNDAPGLVDVRMVLEESLAMASSAVTPGIRLERELAPVPPVLADPHGLGQVFVNLLVNAAQALAVGTEQPCIRVATEQLPDGRVQVEVRDNGRGILPEHLTRIFEPFFTTKPVGVGTGLGLSICHGIISGLGGELTVESQPGEGATFRVVLPAAPAVFQAAS
jgi:two-component system NtrC family sensor kinase